MNTNTKSTAANPNKEGRSIHRNTKAGQTAKVKPANKAKATTKVKAAIKPPGAVDETAAAGVELVVPKKTVAILKAQRARATMFMSRLDSLRGGKTGHRWNLEDLTASLADDYRKCIAALEAELSSLTVNPVNQQLRRFYADHIKEYSDFTEFLDAAILSIRPVLDPAKAQ